MTPEVKLPVVSSLTRRDRLWPAVAVSVALHAGAIAAALLATPPEAPPLAPITVTATILRRGVPKPDKYLPHKDAAAPAPAPEPARETAPVAPPTPPAAPRPTPSPAAPASARPSQAKAPATGGPVAGARLARALQSAERQLQTERETWGSPDGDPEGNSDTAEGDPYLARVTIALRANWGVPPTIPQLERVRLQAVVHIWIDPDGRLSRWTWSKRSGNDIFDQAVERTVGATQRVPPPPATFHQQYPDGVLVPFTGKDE